MNCLVRFYDNWLIIELGDAGDVVGTRQAIQSDYWNYDLCDEPTTAQGVEAFVAGLPIDPVPTVPAGEILVADDWLFGEPPDPGVAKSTKIGAIIFIVLGTYAAISAWNRRARKRPSTSKELDAWKARVCEPGVIDPRKSFPEAEILRAVKRAGGICEWVDPKTFERCEVVHGVNGVKLHGDHMIPRQKGGKTIPENCGAICHFHNVGQKSDNIMPDSWYLAVFANRAKKPNHDAARKDVLKDIKRFKNGEARVVAARITDELWEDDLAS